MLWTATGDSERVGVLMESFGACRILEANRRQIHWDDRGELTVLLCTRMWAERGGTGKLRPRGAGVGGGGVKTQKGSLQWRAVHHELWPSVEQWRPPATCGLAGRELGKWKQPLPFSYPPISCWGPLPDETPGQESPPQ